jgi:hypothetical protein
LSHIIKETNAKIVLSSSWRVLLEDFQLVEAALLNHNLEIFDCTPVLNSDHYVSKFGFVFRNVEIQAWIDANERVENFAILDDDPRANIEGFFFQVDENIGLTMKIAEKVISHLNES